MSFNMLNDDYDNSFRPLHTGGVVYFRPSRFLNNAILEREILIKKLINEVCRKIMNDLSRNFHRRSFSLRR